jgi:hypothetical protein
MERVVQLSKPVELKKDSQLIAPCTVEEPADSHADVLCPIEEDVELLNGPVHVVVEPPTSNTLKDLSRCYREVHLRFHMLNQILALESTFEWTVSVYSWWIILRLWRN